MRSKQRHRGRSSAPGGMRGNVANRADRKQRFRPLQLLWQQQSVCLGIRSFGRSHHRHLLCPLDTDASRRPRRQLRPDLRQVGGAGHAGGSLSGFACLSIIQRHTAVHGHRWRWPPSQRIGGPCAPTVGRLWADLSRNRHSPWPMQFSIKTLVSWNFAVSSGTKSLRRLALGMGLSNCSKRACPAPSLADTSG